MARTLKSIIKAQGRLRKLAPVAIIDIGSNSVRLVVYEGLSRSPTPLFNEKILCGLGSTIATTGRLHDEGTQRALSALKRFRMLADQAGADEIHTLATAAAREAENGPAFIKTAQEILGRDIHVLSGEEEAQYAAYGIQCGFLEPQGVVADMGGGSVEFTRVNKDDPGQGITLPLGGLRLAEVSNGDLAKAKAVVRSALKDNAILKSAKGGTFFAIGGTWRALGRLHMERSKYPLSVMHHYEIASEEAKALCRRLTSDKKGGVRGMSAISSNRRALMPYGAVLLAEIIAVMKPQRIVFSGLGVREGYLYSLLPPKTRKLDPLATASEEFAVLRARSPAHARELVKWTGEAFKIFGIRETKDEKRYRKAACLLSDITWRSHPDYRGDQALNLISNADFVGVDHPGRAYIAMASYYRHEGLVGGDISHALISIASTRLHERAKYLGALFRVAFLMSAAMPGVLKHISFAKGEAGTYQLQVPRHLANFEGERLNRRIKALDALLEREVVWTLV